MANSAPTALLCRVVRPSRPVPCDAAVAAGASPPAASCRPSAAMSRSCADSASHSSCMAHAALVTQVGDHVYRQRPSQMPLGVHRSTAAVPAFARSARSLRVQAEARFVWQHALRYTCMQGATLFVFEAAWPRLFPGSSRWCHNRADHLENALWCSHVTAVPKAWVRKQSRQCHTTGSGAPAAALGQLDLHSRPAYQRDGLLQKGP